MDRKHSCPACNAQASGCKTRIPLPHTCGKIPRKKQYMLANDNCPSLGGNHSAGVEPAPLTEDQRIKAAKLWIGAIVDSAGFPLFGDAITIADAQAIAKHVKTFMVDFTAPGSAVTSDTASIIRYVKKYTK